MPKADEFVSFKNLDGQVIAVPLFHVFTVTRNPASRSVTVVERQNRHITTPNVFDDICQKLGQDSLFQFFTTEGVEVAFRKKHLAGIANTNAKNIKMVINVRDHKYLTSTPIETLLTQLKTG